MRDVRDQSAERDADADRNAIAIETKVTGSSRWTSSFLPVASSSTRSAYDAFRRTRMQAATPTYTAEELVLRSHHRGHTARTSSMRSARAVRGALAGVQVPTGYRCLSGEIHRVVRAYDRSISRGVRAATALRLSFHTGLPRASRCPTCSQRVIA